MEINFTLTKSMVIGLASKTQKIAIRFLILLLLIFFSTNAYAQKKGGSKKGKGRGSNQGHKKEIVIRVCTQRIGNGLYKAYFGYENPSNKEMACKKEDSYLKFKKSNKRLNGVYKFKPGKYNKAFSTVFHEKEVVEWKVILPNGKIHIIIASANSSHCSAEEEGVIFPVHGQGDGKDELQSIIGLDNTSLAEGNAGDLPTDIIFQINNEQEVLVEIIPTNGNMQAVINLLQSTYNLQFNTNPLTTDFLIDPTIIISENLTSVDCYFPIANLLELNAQYQIINFVRPIHKTRLNSGIVTSQGDAAQKSDLVRESFKTVSDDKLVPIDGTGIKLGVISDSYDTEPFTGISKATVDVLNGDLPGVGNPNGYETPVDVILDAPKEASDEGRAMLQIAHDVAPGAELAFHTGSQSPRVFELGLQALDDASCDIIVDDLTFITEPFFGEGRIAQAITDFANQDGKLYFSSAGNFSNHGYQSQFNAATSTINTNFLDSDIVNVPHVFGVNSDGSQDVLQKISVEPGTYMIVLQWDEGLASQENSEGASTDLDIYLVDDDGKLIVGNNRFNQEGDPTEVMVFEATGTGEVNILITSVGGAPNPGLSFRYIAFLSNGLEFMEYNSGAPTVSGHAMTPAANTIGAVDYRYANNPVIESFSSIGGTLSDQSSVEIDFSAPDGGNINMPSFGQDSSADEDSFTNFYGTSAAAPHAAGAAALLMSALPSWYPNGLPDTFQNNGTGTNDVMSLFKQTAIPFGNTTESGAGLIDVEKAFQTIASQSPKIIKLIVEDDKTPSAEPFELTIVGEHFTEESVVVFDGEEVEIISRNENEIVAIIGTFTGNPDLMVNALSKTETGVDGKGDPIKILEDGKIAFNIIADEIAVEFGQTINYSYTVEGLPEGETLESIGLPAVSVTSPAFLPYPDVNNYAVTPSFETELTEEQLALYQVNFKGAVLTVNRKDIVIQPEEISSVYGDPIIVGLQYLYDATGIENNAEFLEAIRTSHQSDFYPENTLVLANKFKAVVNDYNILELLNNGSWIASERTIQNKFRAVVNGMQVIDLEQDHFTDYIDSSLDVSTNKFKAVVNKFRAVVNSADLLNGKVELSLENKFKAVVNSSGLGGEEDNRDYSTIFAIVDAEDASTDTEERSIDKLYALNLITGLDVTPTIEDWHHVFPGGAIGPIFSNLNVTYNSNRSQITKADLFVETNDIIIQQGEDIDENLIMPLITGFVYEENLDSVFPDGISYYFENEDGEEYQKGNAGVYDIKIRAPLNYNMVNNVAGKLYVNPCGKYIRKVRTYLDCVTYNPNAVDGLYFTANFRYKNPNSSTVYVLEGEDNNLISNGLYDGNTPNVFEPGEGEFEIRFDGSKLIWNLTTNNYWYRSCVTSTASAYSKNCDDSGIVGYSFYPNPVENILNIQQNYLEQAKVEIFNSYGMRKAVLQVNGNELQTLQINMQNFHDGMYFVKISSNNGVKILNIIKK